jgi:hypothetical protein
MNDAHIEKIKSRGYWRINFQPLVFKDKIESVSKCFEIISKNAVYLRGWKYPHIPNRSDEDTGTEYCDGYFQAWVDWGNHKEFWRMYQSGQYLHYLALREDWLDEDTRKSDLADRIKPMSSLNVITTVYQMTEIYLFIERLISDGIYDEGVNISVSLINTKGRRLWISDFLRGDFNYPRVTGAERIDYTMAYEASEVLSNYKQIALKGALFFFDRFGWDSPPLDTLKKDQEDFLAQKL